MNLEKTINKNMFNVTSAIRNANPLSPPTVPKPEQHESHEPSTALSSLLSHPKQKLTTQFKRAITMMKQRNDQLNESASVSSLLSSQGNNHERGFDSSNLPSLVEESTQSKESLENINQPPTSSVLTSKSPAYTFTKPQSNETASRTVATDSTNQPTATVLSMDAPIVRTHHPNSPPARIVKQSLQQIHSSILQTMQQHNPLSPPTASSSNTLNPTSSSASKLGTGEVAILETIL